MLDTNFIFSVLKLHDNPGNEAALSLIEVAQKSGQHLEIKLYVLPGTLDEAKRVLVDQVQKVERIRTTAAMARAALTQPLPSIARKFFDAAAKSPGLTARAFFQPYIDNLRIILHDKRIAVLEANSAMYSRRQDVIDDVLGEQSREEQELHESKRKGYETLLHDVILWHAVKDRRPENTDSPFEVEYWAVSIDWRLIAFDRQKRISNASKIPVVLHPSNLVQLVQFWVPRSQELDASLVDSLRLPLFFQSFDPEDERATVKVLEAISRFENVGDIPERTLKVILANQVLRGRLRDADASNDETFELVRDELLTMHKETVESLENTEGNLATIAASLDRERKSRQETEKALRDTGQQLVEAKAQAVEAAKCAANAEMERSTHLEESSRQITVANAAASTALEAAAVAQASLVRLRYLLCFVLAPVAIGVTLWYLSTSPIAKFADGKALITPHMATVAIGLVPLALSFAVSPLFTKRHALLETWWLSKFVNIVGKKAVVAPLSLGLTSIYQSGIWEWVRAFTGWTP